jgi:hypothetical protein
VKYSVRLIDVKINILPAFQTLAFEEEKHSGYFSIVFSCSSFLATVGADSDLLFFLFPFSCERLFADFAFASK